MRSASGRRVIRQAYASPSGFDRLRFGRRVLYLRRDLVMRAPLILASLDALGSSQGAGNRSSGFTLKLDDGIEVFARIARRGGLMRLAVKDLYLGFGSRPLRELAIAVEACRRGIPVAEPLGAVIESVAPLVYRSTFLTRPLSGMTLWEFVRTDDDALVRMHVIERARAAINRMHEQGLFHADLNLHNIFVTQVHESFAVVVLDLDKARFLQKPLEESMRKQNLARLRRSIRKLDPGGKFLDATMVQLLAGS